MFKLMQSFLVMFCSYLTHRQALLLSIRLSYRFVTTSAFSDIRFLKVLRSEKKKRWGGITASNYTLLSMIKVVLSQSK
nr:hypothetical protein [Candidatus Enterovibrio escacola]